MSPVDHQDSNDTIPVDTELMMDLCQHKKMMIVEKAGRSRLRMTVDTRMDGHHQDKPIRHTIIVDTKWAIN